MLFKTLPMVAVSTPAPAMRHFDAYRGEALRREIDQLDRRELDEEKFLARRSVGRELYDKNSFPDMTVNEFGEPRASRWRFKKGKGSSIVTPNLEKLEAGSKLREFYKKLLETDAKIQKLRSIVPGRNIYAGARNFADRVKRSLFHWKHKEGKHKGNATKPKLPKKLAPKKTQIHKKYNVHFKNSTKGHEKEVYPPMRSRRHLNSTETPGLIFEKKKLLVKYVPKNLKLARLSTIMRNFKQTNDEPTIFDDFFDQFVDKKVTWKETNTASPFVDKLITYRSSLQETTPWYPFHAFYTTPGNLYRQYVKPTMFRAKNFKYNFLRKPEKKPDDMRNTATTIIDTMKRESSTRKFTTTSRKTTTPEPTSTMPMITNYDMLISISTLMRNSVSEFLNLAPVRRLMQAEEEDQEGIGYEDFKEVLSDEMEGHDDTDKKLDRMKRDEPENKPFNLEDKKFLDNSRKYNPPLYHNPNWKGPMPLYPDELNTMIKTAVMQNMNKEMPDVSVLSKDVGERDFQSDALDTQYIEDYFNNKYEKLVKMAQAYSDYGVLEGKKAFQRSEKAQAAVNAVKADRIKMSLDQMLEPGAEKSAQPDGYEGFKITFSSKPAEGNQAQGTKSQKLVSPVTSLVETSPMTTTSENQDMQQMDNSDKNTFDETFSMGLFKRSLKSIDIDDIDYNHLSRGFKRSLKSVDADEAALGSDDSDNSYLDPSKDYFDGPRLYHMKMAQAYSDYGVLEGKKEVQRYEKSQADNAKSERYKMSLARQLEPTEEKHAEGWKDGFKFSFANKPLDSKPISTPSVKQETNRLHRLSEKAVDKPAPEHEGFRISFSKKNPGNKNTRNSYDDMYAMSRFRRSLKSIDTEDIDYTDMFRVYIDGPNSYHMDSEKYVLGSDRASRFRRSIINELLDYENAYDSKRILKRSILSEIENVNDQSRKNGYNHNPIIEVDNDWVVLDDIETLVDMVSDQSEFKDDDKDKQNNEPYRDNVYENKTINIEDLEEKIRNFVKLTNLVSENGTNVLNDKNVAVNDSETEDKLNDVSKLKRSVKTEGEEYYDRDYDDDGRDNIDNVFVTVYRGSYSTNGNEMASDKTSELSKEVSSTETSKNATEISLATDSKTALATTSKTVSATDSKINTTAVIQVNITEEATTAIITNDNAALHTDVVNATFKDLEVIAVKREYTSKATVKDVVNTVKMEDKSSGNKTASNPLDFFMILSNWFSTLAGFIFKVNNTITNPQTHIIQLLKELNKPNKTVAQTTRTTPEMAYPMYDADGIENIGHRSRVLMSIDEANATEKTETSDGTSDVGVKGTFSPSLMPSHDTPDATTVLQQINITESTKPLAINATGDKAQSNKNKTIVKRDINIEDSNLIFWNDLYDDEYGVNIDPMDKALNGKARVESDILKKSENWLQEKMRKLKDTVKKKSRDSFERILHGKRRRRARAALGLQKKFERSDAEELEEQEHKKGFALLTAHMRQVCKKAAKTVDEIRNMEVQKPLPEDAVPSGLMQQMVRLLSDLVDYQVQMRSCIKLPDHLRSFLVWLTSPQMQQPAPQQPVQPLPVQHSVQRSLAAQRGVPEASSQKPKKQESSDNASPPMESLAEDHRPATTETERPAARSDCLGTLRAVADLIREYDGMGDEDKSKMVGVREYLQNQLNFLRLLNDQRGMSYPHKIRRRRRIADPKLLRRQKKHCKTPTEPAGAQKPIKYKGRLEKFIRNFGKKHTKSTANSYDNFQVSAETCKKGNIVDTVDKFMEAIDEIDPQKFQRILRATGYQKRDPVEGFHFSVTTDRPTTLRVQKDIPDSPKVVMLK